MYNSKLAIAVKSSGKVLRERGDTVYLPFGSEYSIFIKNLNSVRVKVRIEIDGKDISDGSGFIIQPNSTIDIERFLRNGNMSSGNRFKFIERTAGVENHRGGIQIEDGLIRVEFEFERESVPQLKYYDVNVPVYRPYPYWWYGPGIRGPFLGRAPLYGQDDNTYGSAKGVYNAEVKLTSSGHAPFRGLSAGGSVSNSADDSVQLMNCTAQLDSFVSNSEQLIGANVAQLNDAGITAPGSVSNQTFTTVSDIYGDGVKHSMVLKLLGEVGEKKVTKPLTVSAKPKCVSCGRTNKSNAKFCAECGTALEII